MTRPDNWRTRLADWLTGGALSQIERLEREKATLREDKDEWLAACVEGGRRENTYRTALLAIAAMETPSANATVKRMAARAREALGE